MLDQGMARGFQEANALFRTRRRIQALIIDDRMMLHVDGHNTPRALLLFLLIGNFQNNA